MVRFLLRRIPRFGLVTLFAAMLLFVSAAGWFKFHLDLWREEEALLADLAKAGVDVFYHRGDPRMLVDRPATGPATMPLGTGALWERISPFAERIEFIGLLNDAPRELVERTARLPYAKQVRTSPTLAPVTTTEATAAKAGFELDLLPTPIVPEEIASLPHGAPASPEEARAPVAGFVDFWRREERFPDRGSIYAVFAMPTRGCRFFARDEGVLFDAAHDNVTITRDWCAELLADGSGFRQTNRYEDPAFLEGIWNHPRAPSLWSDARESLRSSLQHCLAEERFVAALDAPKDWQAERIDERTWRLHAPPLVVDYPADATSDVFSVAMIVRADLDWSLEAYDVRCERTQPPTATFGPPPSASFRGKLGREGDFVVVEEWVVEWPGNPRTAGPPSVGIGRMAGVARYDFTYDIDLSHVTPETLGAWTFPPRRELPWLRWYRATFAMSLGLFAFVGVRRLTRRSCAAHRINDPPSRSDFE